MTGSALGISREMPCDGIIPAASAFFVVPSSTWCSSDMVAEQTQIPHFARNQGCCGFKKCRSRMNQGMVDWKGREENERYATISR